MRETGSSLRITDPPMRVLLDSRIFSHSEFAEGAIKGTPVRWGRTDQVLPVHGLGRKAPDQNLEYQRQKEALFTVGRRIREGRIEAYDYSEIRFERMRGQGRIREFNALQGCQIRECQPALERSRFRQTVDLTDAISKGGKKDRKVGVELGTANQLAFLEGLCRLRRQDIDVFIQHGAQIGLTEFDIDSLRNVDWFQFFSGKFFVDFASNEPDEFLW